MTGFADPVLQFIHAIPVVTVTSRTSSPAVTNRVFVLYPGKFRQIPNKVSFSEQTGQASFMVSA